MKYFSDFKIVIDGPYRILGCQGIMERERCELVGPTSSGYIELAGDVISTSNVAQLPNLHSYQCRPAVNVAQLSMLPNFQCRPGPNVAQLTILFSQFDFFFVNWSLELY